MRHNAEPEAVDILLEVERLDWLAEHVDDKNYSRSVAAGVVCGGYQRRSPALSDRACKRPATGRYCSQLRCFACKHMYLALTQECLPGNLQVGLAYTVPAAGNCTP